MRLLCCRCCWSAAARPAPTRQRPPKMDTGDTAWMLTSTALVLLMTVPGLGSVLCRHGAQEEHPGDLDAVLRRSAASSRLSGWSLATASPSPTATPMSATCRASCCNGIADHISKGNDTRLHAGSGIKDVAPMATTIPETVYMMFQMTFAIITPALIAGAFADRMKFSALCIFMTLWSLLVYSPIAHWVWAPTGWSFAARACSTSRRHGRAHQRRHRRADVRAGARQARRLRQRQHGAV